MVEREIEYRQCLMPTSRFNWHYERYKAGLTHFILLLVSRELIIVSSLLLTPPNLESLS